MATKQVFISVDGLVSIAIANGMERYTRAIDSEVCAVVLSVGDMDFCYSYSMDDVRADGSGNTSTWRDHHEQMFKSWSLGKAIRTHFKDAVVAAENELA
jgi:hypothetical protein